MRQLHVLGVTDDGTTLLLGTSDDATRASHRLPLDDRLRAAVRGQLPPPGADRAESALSPKEMQSRLRAGDTPEQVAKAAGVPVARVLPYAAPVIAERQRVVDEARAAVLHRNRGPDGQRPLGDTVDAHLAEVSGLRGDSVEWTARRRADGAWVVLLSYAARGGRRSAQWLWRPAEHELTALDVAATRLAAENGTPAARKKPAPKPASRTRATAKRAAGTRAGTKRAAGTRAATKAAAKRAATAAAKPPAARKAAAAKPQAARKAPAARKVPAARKAPAVRKAPAARKPPAAPKAPAAQPAAAARRSGGHVPLPSWSDVLLGVQATARESAARRAGEPARGRRTRRTG